MLVSTKGRYALRVLIDLAQQAPEHYIPLKEIAGRQDISEKYLESILRILVKANILTGVRGKGGGYRFTLPPDQYTVATILLLTEDTLSPVACIGGKEVECQRKTTCSTISMWEELHQLIHNYLNGITIADLVKNHPIGNDYII